MSIRILDEIKDDEWNRFWGVRIAPFLCEFSELWESLRVPGDTNLEKWGTDTIYIYPKKGKERYVYLLGQSLGANEVDWRKDLNGAYFLRCWWD